MGGTNLLVNTICLALSTPSSGTRILTKSQTSPKTSTLCWLAIVPSENLVVSETAKVNRRSYSVVSTRTGVSPGLRKGSLPQRREMVNMMGVRCLHDVIGDVIKMLSDTC